MRPLLPGDIDAATARLLTLPEEGWPMAASRLLAEAELAEEWHRTHGRPHPVFGNGSLMAAARRGGSARHPCRLSPPVIRAMLVLLSSIKSRQEAGHGL